MDITKSIAKYLVLGPALFIILLSGCSSAVSANPEDYVGEYVFTPYGAAPGQFADFIILKRDGIAVEIRFSKASGQISTNQESWRLYPGSYEEDLVIAKRGYPIERSGTSIKLVINDDLGEYYTKIR